MQSRTIRPKSSACSSTAGGAALVTLGALAGAGAMLCLAARPRVAPRGEVHGLWSERELMHRIRSLEGM